MAGTSGAIHICMTGQLCMPGLEPERICPRCLLPKPEDSFNSPRKTSKCAECRPILARERWTRWRDNNREKMNAGVRRYRAERYIREGRWRDAGPKAAESARWMAEIRSAPCADCGNSYDACCMDFDHKPGTVKEYNIGSMFAHHYGRELIESELAKCELVCSNCHRIRTRDRRTGSGTGGRGA